MRGLVPGEAHSGAEDEHDEASLVHPHAAEHVAEPTDLGGQQRDH